MAGGRAKTMDLEIVSRTQLESPMRQMRAMEVRLGEMGKAILAAYGADAPVDPWVEMFFYPTGTLKLALFTLEGRIIWKKDLGRAVVPGEHFCPVKAFDLDGDGVDEIWYVDNLDAEHPLSVRGRRIRRLDALTGESTGDWPWPSHGGDQSLSHQFRNFIVGGRVRGQPVLVTAQGTYQDMHVQGWRPGMQRRWELTIAKDAPGARGSHMSPVVDLNNDGVDELLWGERCIELDAGRELFCADRDSYRGHSDVIQPVMDRSRGRWFVYTCRESDPKASPRVVLFDDRGRRVWGHVDQGHIDMGWVARIGDGMRHVAMAIRIGDKTAGPRGLFHSGMTEFAFDALTGEPVELPFNAYQTQPVDLDGDGYHELVRCGNQGDGEVLDHAGTTVGRVEGRLVLARRFRDLPGEQLLTYREDGGVLTWADRNAAASGEALARYANSFYRAGEPVCGI